MPREAGRLGSTEPTARHPLSAMASPLQESPRIRIRGDSKVSSDGTFRHHHLGSPFHLAKRFHTNTTYPVLRPSFADQSNNFCVFAYPRVPDAAGTFKRGIRHRIPACGTIQRATKPNRQPCPTPEAPEAAEQAGSEGAFGSKILLWSFIYLPHYNGGLRFQSENKT